MLVLLLFLQTQLGLVVPPPTNLGATLLWRPPNIILAGLNVSEITRTKQTGHHGTKDHRVRAGIFQPNRFVLNVVDNLAARNGSAA